MYQIVKTNIGSRLDELSNEQFLDDIDLFELQNTAWNIENNMIPSSDQESYYDIIEMLYYKEVELYRR